MKNLCDFSSSFSFPFSLRSDVVRYVFNELFRLPLKALTWTTLFHPWFHFTLTTEREKHRWKSFFIGMLLENIINIRGRFAEVRERRASDIVETCFVSRENSPPVSWVQWNFHWNNNKNRQARKKMFFFLLHENVLFHSVIKNPASITRKRKRLS